MAFVSPRAVSLPGRKSSVASPMPTNRWKSGSGRLQAKKSCPYCNDGSHPTFRCRRFKDATIQQRLSWSKQHKLCDICLHSGHSPADCTNTFRCRICDGRHNYLLHVDDQPKKKSTTLTTAGSSYQSWLHHDCLGENLQRIQINACKSCS